MLGPTEEGLLKMKVSQGHQMYQAISLEKTLMQHPALLLRR